MRDFIYKLLESNSGLSSKRFLSLVGLAFLLAFLIVDWCGIGTKEYQFWGIIGIITSMQGITYFKKSSPPQI
jgi:hypothetical protein